MIKNGRSNKRVITLRKRPFKVLVCLVTLVAFLFNTVSYDLAWAARSPLEPTAVGSNRAGGPDSPGFIVKELSVDTFSLPEYLGHIKDSHKGGPEKVVVHIQDAHCNYAAQLKIAEIIGYLNKKYGVDTINLEGGARDYDLSVFTGIDDKAIRDKVTDYFVKEGLVNGAESFAINNPEKLTLWGIEDARLYIDNLSIYRESLKYKDKVDKHINALTHILGNLKNKIYSPGLLELDAKYSQYKAGSLEFKTYLSYLIETAKEKAIDIKAFKNIYLLNQALISEETIDFRKANNERDDLIDKLQKRLSKNELEELVLKTVEFKSEKISQDDFYAYLVSKAKSINLGLNEFPWLQKYIVYVSVYNAVDKIAVMDEVDSLESRIKEILYRNDDEMELNKLSKNLTLLKNLFNISLTPNDYKYYKANERSFGITNYTSFINRQAPLYHITAKLDGDISNLDTHRDNAARFFECSFKRDTAFIKNLKFQAKIVSRKMRNTILITGGFHAENLYDVFKKQDISYISIMPNFKNETNYECPYFKLLAGRRDNPIIKKLSSILGSTIAIPGPFTILVDDVRTKLGGEYTDKNALKLEVAWQEARERGLGLAVMKNGQFVGAILSNTNQDLISPETWNGMGPEDRKQFIVTDIANIGELERSAGAPTHLTTVPTQLGQGVQLRQKEIFKKATTLLRMVAMSLPYIIIIFSFVSIVFSDPGKIILKIIAQSKYIITVDTKPIKIVDWPDHFNTNKKHIEYLLSLLPKTHLEKINGIVFTLHQTNQFEGFAIRSNLIRDIIGFDFVVGGALGGDPSIIDHTFMHEAAHIIYLRLLTEEQRNEWESLYKKSEKASTFGNNAEEDFAGIYAAYITNSIDLINSPNEMSNGKYFFIARLFMEPDASNNTILTYYVQESGIQRPVTVRTRHPIHDIDFSYLESIMNNSLVYNASSLRQWFDVAGLNGEFSRVESMMTIERLSSFIEASIAKRVDEALNSDEVSKEDKNKVLVLKEDVDQCRKDISLLYAFTKTHPNIDFRISPAVVDRYDMPTLLDIIKKTLSNAGYRELTKFQISIMTTSSKDPLSDTLSIYLDNDIVPIKCDIKELGPKLEKAIKEKIEKVSNLPLSTPTSQSLIGKLLDRNGKIVTSFDVAQKADGRAILIQHNGETLAEVPLATDPTVDKNTILSGLTRFLDSRKELLPPHAKDLITQLIGKMKNVDAIVALEHHKDVKGAFYETNGQYTLYLSEGILNNLLGLIHELGEGVITLPKGYRNLTRHTIMRGAGKDVRNAFDAVEAARASDAKTAGDLIRMLDQAMKKEDFTMSNNRSRDSPITKSEKDLIRWNFENGRRDKEALFGIQDFLSIKGNAKFTQDIRNLNRDLRQGVLNIFLMRSRIDTKSAETVVGREMGRKLEKNLGVNTQMLYFEDKDSLTEQLVKAINYATAQENKDKLPKIFVDCLTEDDWNAVNAFKDNKRQEYPNIDGIIAIGRDFIEGETAKELPDEVKVILVGNAIMNDRRLKDDFKISPENLLESRRRTIDFLMSNRIIDQVTITNDQIEMFFNDLWKGIKRLLITRINWKEFQDWKNSQDEVLRAL